MSNVGRVFTSASPWIVGREALLTDAVDDFLHEMTRRKPWVRRRYEALLGELVEHLDAALERPAPLTALSYRHANAWLKTTDDRALAERALADFTDYLVKWGWLGARPLRQLQAV